MEGFGWNGMIVQFVQTAQSPSSIAAAGADTGGKREVFLEVYLGAATAGGFKKNGGRSMDEIVSARGKARVTAGQLDAFGIFFKSNFVMQRHGQHDGFDFVKTIVAPAGNIEKQIDFAGRFDDEAHDRLVLLSIFLRLLFAEPEPRDKRAQFIKQLKRHRDEAKREGIAGGRDDSG